LRSASIMGAAGQALVEPTVATADDAAPLTEAQVAAWREQGFVLVDGIFPHELVSSVQHDMVRMPPGRLGQGLQFPSGSHALNSISTHPRLRAAVAQLLGATSLQLLQSEAWSKSPPSTSSALLGLVGANAYSNSDQRTLPEPLPHSPWAMGPP
jgi:hypothetical protein